MAVVDTKADIKADKREERLKNADKNILGAAAVGMGRRRCGPGAGATPFGDARASDERALADVLRRRNSGVGAMASDAVVQNMRHNPRHQRRISRQSQRFCKPRHITS